MHRTTAARVGLVVAAAVLGMTAAIGPAGADPSSPPTTDTTDPAPTSSSEPPSSAPPSSAPPSSTAPSDPYETKRLTTVVVRATFDKPSYRTGEAMAIRFSVGNDLGQRLTNVRVQQDWSGPGVIQTEFESWGALATGATIEAGSELTVTVIGRAGNPAATTAVLAGTVSEDTGPNSTAFSFSTPMTPRLAHAAGTVYGDANHNGRFDAGEGLAGARVTVRNTLFGGDRREVTTGPGGTFSIPDLATVAYEAGIAARGWQHSFFPFTVAESGTDGLLFRVLPALDRLRVSLKFGKDSYLPGERVTLRVTLTNPFATPLTGIVVQSCFTSHHPNNLTGTGPGWAALSGDGVDIAPHKTVVRTVWEKMPARAPDFGFVDAVCFFGFADPDSVPRTAQDRARVTRSPAPHSPAPQGKADGLAYTGSSVVAVALTGLAVLVLGAAGVAAARRRKA